MWPRRIVLVDGHSDFRQLVSLLLRARRHEVVEACDGATGLAAIEEERPDAVFVDLEVAGPSAYELARRVRRDHELASVVLIALHDGHDSGQVARAIEAGFDVCLTAPTSADELEAALRTPMMVQQDAAQPSMFDSTG
jgi:DNA-binding response OmpR family regulator